MTAPQTESAWRTLSDPHTITTEWAHPGVLWRDDAVFVTDPSGRSIIEYDLAGAPRAALHTETHEVHAIAGGAEGSLWLADPGEKECRQSDGSYRTERGAHGGQVVHVDSTGRTLRRIGAPELEAYKVGAFRPTSIAASAGRLWVADGYGSDLVHEFGDDGERIRTLGGGEGMTLNNPHSLHLDSRRPDTLLISDRGNSRILIVNAAAGTVRGLIEGDCLDRPSGLATWGGYLFVADLAGRLAVFDEDDVFLGHLGDLGDAAPPTGRPGWPNALAAGLPVAPPLRHGQLNSPHDLDISADGRLVVAEWLIGGRVWMLDAPTLIEALHD